METVEKEEAAARRVAHVLDDTFRFPGSAFRFGLDPLIGILPGYGDALATALGASLLVFACRLRLPLPILLRMTYKLFLNGMLGAVPFFGDAVSFWYRSNAKNVALLIREVARGRDGACRLEVQPLRVWDVLLVITLSVLIVGLVRGFSAWLEGHGVSILS